MKIAIIALVSLMVGLGVGWHFGKHWDDLRITNEAVKLMIDSSKSSERFTTMISIKAINYIETDDEEKAVRLLSHPLANYYQTHIEWDTNDEIGMRLLSQIKQLTEKNKIVAEVVGTVTNEP